MNDNEIINKLEKTNLNNIRNMIVKGQLMGISYINDNVLFTLRSASPFKQDIINLAIDYCLENGCKSGFIDFNYLYNYNHQKNCQHIELIKDDVTLTHSSCNYSNFPRKAKFRESLSTNQLSLFGKTQYEMKYGILMHSLDFNTKNSDKIILGVPDSTCKRWANYIDLNMLANDNFPYVITKNIENETEKFSFAMKKPLNNIIENR